MGKIWTKEEEAENLERLFKGVRRTTFAKKYNVPGGANMIYQHVKGIRPISIDAAKAYATGFNCKISEISPRLAAEIMGVVNIEGFVEQPIQNKNVASIDVPVLNAVGSMGNGTDAPDYEVVIDVLRISKAWADKALSQISNMRNLAFIHAIGDSMHPTFNDGDILLIDTGNKDVKEDKIYVLEAHGRLFIKRVRQRIDGEFEISSDNPAVKTVDILKGSDEVVIKGRVVWVWNGKKL